MFHFDKRSGDLFIADVGQNHWEEINWQPASSKGGENYGWRHNQAPSATRPQDPARNARSSAFSQWPNIRTRSLARAPKLKDGYGCSAQGLGVANYAGFEKAYLIGDWCTGRLWGLAWDNGGNKWQLQELLQAQLQFTAGQADEDGTILATNCYCFYTEDKGPTANPPGALWRIVPADKVPSGAEVAKVVAK